MTERMAAKSPLSLRLCEWVYSDVRRTYLTERMAAKSPLSLRLCEWVYSDVRRTYLTERMAAKAHCPCASVSGFAVM